MVPERIGLRVNPFGDTDTKDSELNNVDDNASQIAHESDLSIKYTVSENNFLEKYRAMKIDLDLSKQHKGLLFGL
jgi:hypothetical protein